MPIVFQFIFRNISTKNVSRLSSPKQHLFEVYFSKTYTKMNEIDVKAHLDLLNDCLDNWMDSLIFDCFVIKPCVVVNRQKSFTDGSACTLATPNDMMMNHVTTPYDCGDPPLINCNALPLNSSSSLNSEVLQQYTDGASEYTDGVSEYTDGMCTRPYASNVTPSGLTDEYTGTGAGSRYTAAGGLTVYNGCASLPHVIAKKKSRAVDIIDPSTGEKVLL